MYTYVPIITIIIIIVIIIIRGLLVGGGFLRAFALSIPMRYEAMNLKGKNIKKKGEKERIRRYFLNHLLSNWSITSHT